jgi:hypothetical protein
MDAGFRNGNGNYVNNKMERKKWLAYKRKFILKIFSKETQAQRTLVL